MHDLKEERDAAMEEQPESGGASQAAAESDDGANSAHVTQPAPQTEAQETAATEKAEDKAEDESDGTEKEAAEPQNEDPAKLETDLTDESKRKDLLKKKLVDAYKSEKSEKLKAAVKKANKSSEADAEEAGGEKSPKDSLLSAVGGALNSGEGGEEGPGVSKDALLSAVGGALGTSEGGESESEAKPDDATSIKDAGSSLIGGAGNIVKLVGNRKARKKAASDKEKSKLTQSSLQSISGLLGNTANLGGSLNNIFGDGSSESATAGKVFTGISAAADLFSSGVGLFGGVADSRLRKKTEKKLEGEIVADESGEEESKSKEALDKNSSTYQDDLKKHKALKAKKYGYAQAQRFMKNQDGRYKKGTFDFIGTAFSSINKLAGLSSAFAGSGIGKLFGTLAPIIGFATKSIEKIAGAASDKRIKNDSDSIKLDEVEKYLERRRAKVERDANNAFPGIELNLSDSEKDRITLARLGVETEITDEPPTEQERMDAFEALNLKRAQQIVDAGDKKLLTNLGLSETASVEDVAAALKGE